MVSPLAAATIQSTLLSIISNVLAQTIKAYTKSVPLVVDFNPIIQFAIFSIISTPLNFIWQKSLESWFPSKVTVPKEKATASSAPVKFSKTNALKKFMTDNAIGGPLNTLMFLATMGYLRGRYGGALVEYIKNEFMPMQVAGMKLWPAVSVLSFTLVPAERRVVFGSLVALGWNVYLGLVMGA
ncbi:hypothetical protein EDC01DRAFT_653262 [Geopyxis carbonaria]|nr:hypothetical protein EDC01DRAFT_653262 [Geopyxis carbonaria]